MTHVPVVLALGLIFAGVARPASPVAVLLQFDAPYSAPAVQAMQREVDSIMRPAGYRLEWHLLDADIAGREFPDLVVVHFQGRCEASALAGTVKNGEALASTAVSDGRVLPFSEVHCDQVRRFLGPGAPKAIGRALGRIVAHEMFHMLTASGQHGKVGVARSAQTTQELVANRELRFDPADLEMLRETHRYPKALPKFPPPGTM